jgi:hypothetical protein
MGWVVKTTLRTLCPRERPGTHCTGAGLASDPVWIGAENLAPPEFDPQTVQPVASRYTDCAIPAPFFFFSNNTFLKPCTNI